MLVSPALCRAICSTAALNGTTAAAAGSAATHCTTQHTVNMFSTRSMEQPSPWHKAVSSAVQLVGRPTSQFTLETLLSERHASVAGGLRELVLERHPLPYIIKEMTGRSSSPQLYFCSLVTLLGSKMMGQPGSTITEDIAQDDILESQRVMAEVAQLCQVSHRIHRAVLNFDNCIPTAPTSASTPTDDDDEPSTPAIASLSHRVKETGNKMAILCGDYLLAGAFQLVASTRNGKAAMYTALLVNDFSKSDFTILNNENKSVNRLRFWKAKTALTSGSIISNSLQAVAHLAGHRDAADLALLSSFGKNAGIAWQAMNELKPYISLSRNFNATPRVKSVKNSARNTVLVADNYNNRIRGCADDSRRVEQEMSSDVNVGANFDMKHEPYYNNAEGSESSITVSHTENNDLSLASNFESLRDLYLELKHIMAQDASVSEFKIDYGSLPVNLHIEKYRRGQPLKEIVEIDEKLLLQEILSEGVGVDEGISVLQEHCDEALRLLQMLPDNEARSLLQSLMEAVSRCEADCEDGTLLL